MGTSCGTPHLSFAKLAKPQRLSLFKYLAKQALIHFGLSPLVLLQSRLIDMPWSDWKIEPAELTIATRPDGSEWLLGSGASGRVSLNSNLAE